MTSPADARHRPQARAEPPAAEPARAQRFGLTVHNVPEPALVDGQRTRHGRVKMLLVLLVCAAPVIASYFTYFVIRPQGRSNYGELIVPPRPLPQASELPLSDLQGRPVDTTLLRGQWLLVVVAESACETPCERALLLQRQLRETLGRERDRVDKLWLVTDAEPVRPALLDALAGGAPTTVLRVPRDAAARWLATAPGPALGPRLLVVDPMGQWMMRMPADPDPAGVKRDIERLLRASASWDRPGR
jgi:hypothetical protein